MRQICLVRRLIVRLRVALASVLLLSLAFPVASLAADKNSIIEDLVVANHILAYKDVVDGYGNVSVRNPKNPNQYFMARSMAPALVSKSDIMTFDLDNNPVGKDTREAYVERFIHGEIYRARPDVNAIVDCHSSALIPFGVTNIPLRPLSDMTAFIASGVPVFEIRDFRPAGEKNMLVNNRELGQALARVLGKGAAALMRGHGAVIVGTSLSQVAGRSFYLDINAKLEMETIALGQPVSYLEPGEGMPSSANLYRNDWEAWKNEVEEDEEDD